MGAVAVSLGYGQGGVDTGAADHVWHVAATRTVGRPPSGGPGRNASVDIISAAPGNARAGVPAAYSGTAAGYVSPGAAGYVSPGAAGYVSPGAAGYVSPGAAGYVSPGAAGYVSPGVAGAAGPASLGTPSRAGPPQPGVGQAVSSMLSL